MIAAHALHQRDLMLYCRKYTCRQHATDFFTLKHEFFYDVLLLVAAQWDK